MIGSGRLLWLDVLRGVACGLVITNHILAEQSCPGWLAALKQAGWIGVDLFFVLSGFLVSGLLFREYRETGQVRIGRFLVRRGLKIYPAFYFFFFVCLLPGLWQGDVPTLRQLAGELLFLQNYVGRLWNHTWTLAVEEHFYLAVCLLMGWLVSRPMSGTDGESRLRVLPALLISFAVALPFFRVAAFDGTWQSSTLPSHLRADSLGLGVLLAYYWQFHHASTLRFVRGRRAGLLLASALLFVPAFVFPKESTPWLVTWGLSGFGLASLCLLLTLLATPSPQGGVWERLAALGTFSYSIYLWHMPVIWWVVPVVMGMLGVESAIYEWLLSLVLSGFVGKVMAELVELPVLSLRNALFPVSAALATSEIAGQSQTKRAVPLATPPLST